MLSTLDSKFEGLERRLEQLESEVMEKDLEIEKMKEKIDLQEKTIEELQERTDNMDANRRLSSLILTCNDFANATPNENIEEKVVQVINDRYPRLLVTTADIQVAHRLQSNDKVIVKFFKRQLRDEIYDGRFSMVSGAGSDRRQWGRPTRQLAPLYVTESLVASRAALYQELLRARRPENGGLVASVFSRRGVVWCRKVKGGENIRVPDRSRLRQILGGACFPPPSGTAPTARRRSLPPTGPSSRRAASSAPAPRAAGSSRAAPATGSARASPAAGSAAALPAAGSAPAPPAAGSAPAPAAGGSTRAPPSADSASSQPAAVPDPVRCPAWQS